MIRRDYILRLIDEIAKMIAAILGLLKEEKIQQAQDLYSTGLKRAIDKDEDEILDMNLDQLRGVFENKFGESHQGLEVLARLLVSGGDIHLKNNYDEKARSCYLKALQILNVVEIESNSFSIERQSSIKKVTQLIDQL